MPKVVYSQKFRTEWLKDPLLSKWLECKASADGKQVAACKHCGCQLGSRYSDLKAHANTKKHRELAGSSSIQKQLGFTTKRQVQPGNAAEGRTALFIAEHSSIMTADHLCQLYKKSFPDSEAARAYQMRRSKCASVIKNVLGPHFKADLAQDIGDSYYSLIIDESTDISVTKFLAISIIYHSVTKSRIMTTFLNLCTLEVCTADGIVAAVKSTLMEYCLKLERMRGVGTDNASVMTGINNGVHRKLKAEAPHLVLIRCVCHSLQLATSAATAEALPRILEYLISETYNWFARSPARQMAYKKLYGLMNDGDEPLKIVQACRTRWLSLEIAVSRIVDQWTELKAH